VDTLEISPIVLSAFALLHNLDPRDRSVALPGTALLEGRPVLVGGLPLPRAALRFSKCPKLAFLVSQLTAETLKKKGSDESRTGHRQLRIVATPAVNKNACSPRDCRWHQSSLARFRKRSGSQDPVHPKHSARSRTHDTVHRAPCPDRETARYAETRRGTFELCLAVERLLVGPRSPGAGVSHWRTPECRYSDLRDPFRDHDTRWFCALSCSLCRTETQAVSVAVNRFLDILYSLLTIFRQYFYKFPVIRTIG
jgi:hypothetical protein